MSTAWIPSDTCNCTECRIARKIVATTGAEATVDDIASVMRAAEHQGISIDAMLEHGFANAVRMQNRAVSPDILEILTASATPNPFISMSTPEQNVTTATGRITGLASAFSVPYGQLTAQAFIDPDLRRQIISSDLARSELVRDTQLPEPTPMAAATQNIVIDELASMMTDAPAVAAIEPMRVPTLEEQRLVIFAERGVTPIPDDECTDMGTYVVWNNYDANCTVFLDDPSRISRFYDTLEQVATAWRGSHDVERQKKLQLRAHPLKPVRLKGWYKVEMTDGSDHKELRYYYTSGGRQRMYVFRYGYADTDSFSTNIDRMYEAASTRGSVRDIPKNERNWFINRERDRIGSNTMVHRMVSVAIGNSVAARKANPGYTGRLGRIADARHYTAAVSLMAEASGMIAKADTEYDADDFVDAISQLQDHDYQLNRVVNNMIEEWNARSTDEVMRASCGHLTTEANSHDTRDGYVCESCWDDNYVYVEDTDDYRQRDNVYQHDDDCYYTYRQGRDDDDYDEDEDEDDENCGGRIKNYSTDVRGYCKPDNTIKPSLYGDFLMGVELEVVPRDGYRLAAVDDTLENLAAGYAILKNDGSLDDGGFEIVTAPRGLAEHIKRFGEWTPHKKLRAWDAGCCGLHVHMSSQAFSQATLGKFIEFICAVENDPMIISIAGRSPTNDSQAQQYCRRDHVFPGNAKATLREKAGNGERYRMVNTQNLSRDEAKRLGLDPDNTNGKAINTVELRIFRASLKKGRLLAQIEFAHAAVMFCRWTSMRELRVEHFTKWLRKSAGMYPHLAKWFGVKQHTVGIDAQPKVRLEEEV